MQRYFSLFAKQTQNYPSQKRRNIR